jgi:competence ComEA-like helix-hairpin-helix protein
MLKHIIHEYLSFTRKERAGIITILGLIIVCLSAPFIYPFFYRDKTYHRSQFDKDVVRLKIKQADSAGKYPYNSRDRNFDENNYANYYEPSQKSYYSRPKAELFFFDPNTASAEEWKRLGIRDKTAEAIQKYISKGGHFYRPADIGKIWGLHKDDVDRLLPFVRIGSVKKEYAVNNSDLPANRPNSYTETRPQTIDINAADTTAFISLPGIGSKLAQRIISFRDKLGGFYSVEQLKETYGLPDSVFQKIKPKLILANTALKPININNATVDEMRSHPYLKYTLANAITQYRTQHGNFSSVADIKKIMIITDEIFNKVAPYLTIN